jgi:Transglutaminase-like superfamily
MWLDKVAELPRQRRRLLAEAFAWLTLAHAGLRFCHFQAIRRRFSAFARAGGPKLTPLIDTDDLVWAFHAARRHYPFETTCLVNAIAAEALFRRFGLHAVLCVGATRSEGQFQAHAWIEANNSVVVGGPSDMVERFTRFPQIDSVTS